eukprot:TRINITY_DN29463_c0_g1_i1.p1 TRINITY_DN29463_c0_g1~~TRINITY_DN29463_c0_g1_i1.p1  ORF type:complete len:893 (+),score=49.98 TRINITY_DN29463_c0_g1_i1:60-2738(+)
MGARYRHSGLVALVWLQICVAVELNAVRCEDIAGKGIESHQDSPDWPSLNPKSTITKFVEPNHEDHLQIQCNSWGFCHDPKIIFGWTCHAFYTYRYDGYVEWHHDHFSLFGLFGVQAHSALKGCHGNAARMPVYNCFYAFIALIVTTSAVSLLLIARYAVATAWQARRPLKSVRFQSYWMAELWNDFPSLFEALPPDLHRLASSKLAEKRIGRFSGLLAFCAFAGPLGCLSALVQYILPFHIDALCSEPPRHSWKAASLYGLDWQRRHCMELALFLTLGIFGLYSLMRPSRVTGRSLSLMTVAAHLVILWHLLEVVDRDDYKEWFHFNYVLARLCILIPAGNLRLTLVLNACLGLCHIAKFYSAFHREHLPAEIRLQFFTAVMLSVVVGVTEYQSIHDTVVSVAAQQATSEAHRGRVVLDTLCDAVASLRGLLIAEACPKLEALMLLMPSSSGMLGRPFLGCIVESERERVRSRIDDSARNNEEAFLIHTMLRSAGLGHVHVQLCISCYQDMHGNQCHMVGVREEDMQEAGRVDNLPTELEAFNTPPLVTVYGHSAGDVAGGDQRSALVAGSSAASSVSSGTAADDSLHMMMVDKPPGELLGMATVWLDCRTPRRYPILKFSRALVYHLGPSLGVSDFTDLLVQKKEVRKFRDWMGSVLSTSTLRLSVRLPHWQTGLYLKVRLRRAFAAEAISEDVCADGVACVRLSDFEFRVNKGCLLPDAARVPLYAKSRRGGSDSAHAPAAIGPSTARGGMSLDRLVHLPTFRTSSFTVTPETTRSLMLVALMRQWHLTSGVAEANCCDLHRRLEAMAAAARLLTDQPCTDDLVLLEAWQCKECGCLYDRCPLGGCRICHIMETAATAATEESSEEGNSESQGAARRAHALALGTSLQL